MTGAGDNLESSKPARSGNKVLLLGLGNDLLTDDAIGLRIARMAAERLATEPGVKVLASSEMGLALLDLVIGCDTLVLVDAIVTGQAPAGFVHELNGSELKSVPAVSPHFLGIGEMLALGKALGLPVPERVKIFAVEVADPFTLGERMTAELERALELIAAQVINSVQMLAVSA